MSEITKKEIEGLAHLARLDLTEQEKEKLTRDLASILDYVAELQKVDTADVDMNMDEHKAVNQLRKDEGRDSGIQEKILKAAPQRKDDFFEVKGVFE